MSYLKSITYQRSTTMSSKHRLNSHRYIILSFPKRRTPVWVSAFALLGMWRRGDVDKTDGAEVGCPAHVSWSTMLRIQPPLRLRIYFFLFCSVPNFGTVHFPDLIDRQTSPLPAVCSSMAMQEARNPSCRRIAGPCPAHHSPLSPRCPRSVPPECCEPAS